MTERELKLVFLGDCAVGKTSIIKRFLTQQFEEEYQATSSIGELTSSIKVNSNIVKLVIWDISGNGINMTNEFASRVFPSFDVFYIVFSCDSRSSYENAKAAWMDLIEPHMKEDSLVIYVASKADLWDEDEVESQVVTSDDIEDVEALECSSLENEGVRAVFHTALRWALQKWENTVDNVTVVKNLLNEEGGITSVLTQPQFLNIFRQLIRQDSEVISNFDHHLDKFVDILVSEDYEVQMSSTVCDLFTNNTKLLGKLINEESLNKILKNLVRQDHSERRREALILRLLNFLLVNHRSSVIEFLKEHKSYSFLIKNINENAIDFISNIMEILKQQKRNTPDLDTNIFDADEIIPVLLTSLENESNISSIAQLLSTLYTIGESNIFLKNLLCYSDSTFLKRCYQLLESGNPQFMGEIISLFTDVIFPVIKLNKDDQDMFDKVSSVVTGEQDLVSNILKSESILTVFYGLQICYGIASSCHSLLPLELFVSMVNIMYQYPLSSTLHILITQSVVSMLENGTESFISSLFEDKSLFVDPILDNVVGENIEYRPHLVNIIKAIENNSLTSDAVADYEKWNEFKVEQMNDITAVPGEHTFSPTPELLKEKERQMQGPRGNRNI